MFICVFGSRVDLTPKGCSCASLPAALKAVCVFETMPGFLAQGFVSNASCSELVQLNSPLRLMNFALLLSNTQTIAMIISAVFAGKLNGICAMMFRSSDTLEGTCVKGFSLEICLW